MIKISLSSSIYLQRLIQTRITLKLFLLVGLLAQSVWALTENHLRVFEVFPSEYAQYGISPFFGPVDHSYLQTVTLIVERNNEYGAVTNVLLHYLNHKDDARLSVPVSYSCSNKKDRCFIEFSVHQRYQNNVQVEIFYQADANVIPISGARYQIKDLGTLSEMKQKHHHQHHED